MIIKNCQYILGSPETGAPKLGELPAKQTEGLGSWLSKRG